MGKIFLIVVSVALLALAGCKDTDNASKWVGTYYAAPGGLYTNTFTQVVIQENSLNTVRLFLNDTLNSQVVTFAVIQNTTLPGATQGSFYETDSVLGFIHPFLLTGSVSLNGNTLTLTGKGTNTVPDTINFYFYGTKQ